MASSATSLPDVQKCFVCHAPSVCKGQCTRASKKGWIYFCEGCARERKCPICRATPHQLDEADFQWGTNSVQVLTRKSPSEPAEDARLGEDSEITAQEATCTWTGSPCPRKYQWEAFRQVCDQNTIVNMDTGLGKTLIAVMSIDHFLQQQREKKVLVCVPTIALANQQAQVIKEQSTVPNLRVVAVTSKITKGTAEWWQQLKEDYQVLVGIGAIFQQALLARAFLRLSELSLIVLDECHNAVGSHPFVSIMQDSVEWKNRHQPRVLGLTASYVNGRTGDLMTRRRKLEETLRSRIWCPKTEDIQEFIGEKSYKTVYYQNDTTELQVLQEQCRSTLEKLLQGYANEGSPLWDCREELKKQQEIAQRCFKEAGFYGWRAFLKTKLLPAVKNRLEMVQADPFPLMEAEESWDSMRPNASPEKLKQLLLLLQDLFSESKSNRCIIFVEQVDDTYPLGQSIDQQMRKPMTRYITGTKTMTQAEQQKALQAFKEGTAPILVATQAIEEGLDVASCNAVVRYHSFHTTKSHIQGAGRARQDSAQIFYFENDPEQEEKQAATMRQAARLDLNTVVESPAAPDYPFFLHPNTDAQVDAYNCLAILQEYAAKITKGKWGQRLFERAEGTIIRCVVPVVGVSHEIRIEEEEVAAYWKQVARSEGEPSITDFKHLLDPDRCKRWTMDDTLQHRFAMVAVRRLSKEGHIDDRNMPSDRAMQGTECTEVVLPEEEALFAKLLGKRTPAFEQGTQGWSNMSNGNSAHLGPLQVQQVQEAIREGNSMPVSNGSSAPQVPFYNQGWSNGTSAQHTVPQEAFHDQGWANGSLVHPEVFHHQGWSNGISAHLEVSQEAFRDPGSFTHPPATRGRSGRAFRAHTQSPSRRFDEWSAPDRSAPYRALTPPPGIEVRRRSPSWSRRSERREWDPRSEWEDRGWQDSSDWHHGWREEQGWHEWSDRRNRWEDREEHWQRNDIRDRREYDREERWRRGDRDRRDSDRAWGRDVRSAAWDRRIDWREERRIVHDRRGRDWREEWRGIDTSRWQGRSSLDAPVRRGERIKETVPAWVTRTEAQAPPAPAKLRGLDLPGVKNDTKTSKMRLNEFLSKYVDPTKKDLEYDTVPAPSTKLGQVSFISTLLLKNLGGKPGEGMAFCGKPRANKQDAEHSASDEALRYLVTLPGAPRVPLPWDTAPTAAESRPATMVMETIANPKGTLQEIVAKKMRRQTPDDFRYDPVAVGNGFIIRLQLAAHVVGDEALTFDSTPFHMKTKKSIKEAEEEVATLALQHLNYKTKPAAPAAAEAEAKPEAPALLALPPVPEARSDQELRGSQAHTSDGRAETDQDVKDEKVETETVKVCLVRPDGKEKCMILLKNMSISDLIQKHKPSTLGDEEVEVVGPGDMVLLPEFTLADCIMVFETQEDVPKFSFRLAED